MRDNKREPLKASLNEAGVAGVLLGDQASASLDRRAHQESRCTRLLRTSHQE